jgi:plasmid maintenance system killer protein
VVAGRQSCRAESGAVGSKPGPLQTKGSGTRKFKARPKVSSTTKYLLPLIVPANTTCIVLTLRVNIISRWCVVDVMFESAITAADYNSEKRLVRLHNKQRAKLIRRRLDELLAAPTLDIMRQLGGRCHELKGNLVLHLSIDLDGPYRLIFYPTHNPVPLKPDGGLDWKNVTTITIKGVTDTHE